MTITAGELRELLSYDETSGEFRWKVKPCKGRHVGDVAGNLNTNGYVQIRIKGKLYMSHRLAWLYVHGEWPKDQIDHIDGNRSNNRLNNLRSVSNRENACNQKSHREGRLFGSHYSKHDKKWRARIEINGKRISLGLFPTEQDAHEAYLKAKSQI